MSEISLRANRLANEFEGVVKAHRDARCENDRTLYRREVEQEIGTVEHVLTTDSIEEAAALLRERGEGVTVSDEQWRRIRQALGAMPHSGLASMRHVEDVDGLVGWLHSMGAVLRGVSDRAQTAERELHALQQQQRAMRTFLGLDGIEAMHEDVADLVEAVDSLRVEQSGDLG